MKRLFSLAMLAMAAFPCAVNAQNIQVHYDLGHSLYNDIDKRPSMTTTMEMFKPDRWGSTFAFIDLDYQRDGVAGTYWEVAREFNLSKDKHWAAHVEYNGGLSSDEETWQATRFQHAVLAGPAWNWASKDFHRTFSVQLLWKYNFKNRHYQAHAYNSVQLTEVWSTTFANGLCTFSATATSGTIPTSTGNGSSSRSHSSGSTSTNSREWTTSTSVWDPRWNCPTTSFGTTEASTTASTPSRRLPPNGLFSVSNVRG